MISNIYIETINGQFERVQELLISIDSIVTYNMVEFDRYQKIMFTRVLPLCPKWFNEYSSNRLYSDETIAQRINNKHVDISRVVTYGVYVCACLNGIAIAPKERMGKQTCVGFVMKTKTTHFVWIRSFIVP